MKNEEALNLAKECRQKGQIVSEAESYEFFDRVIEALEKQIPKKPSYIYNDFDKSSKRWRCPDCTVLLYEIDKDNCAWGHQADYCEDCGQHIDWSEEDDE